MEDKCFSVGIKARFAFDSYLFALCSVEVGIFEAQGSQSFLDNHIHFS